MPQCVSDPSVGSDGSRTTRWGAWAALALASAALAFGIDAAGLPAAYLIGPMVSAIGAAILGPRLTLPKLPYRFAQALVGCMIVSVLSAKVAREVLAEWPVFLGGVFSVVAAATLSGVLMSRLKVLPGTTAIWGSSPGAATVMTLMSANYGADMRLVAVMQYSRVIAVAVSAAIVAHLVGDVSPRESASGWLAVEHPSSVAITFVLAGGAVVAARFVRIPAAPLVLPILVGSLLQLAGGFQLEIPKIFLVLAYALVGWGIGFRFDRAALRHAADALPWVLSAIFALMLACAGLGGMLTWLADVDLLTAYLATSPGGADTVAIVSASVDVDVAFVMSMQLARMFVTVLLGPPLARLVSRMLGARVAAEPQPSPGEQGPQL